MAGRYLHALAQTGLPELLPAVLHLLESQVCPSICLGVMQSVEGHVGTAASNTLLKKFSKDDNSPGIWTSLGQCTVDAIAQAIRAEGHECSSIAAEVSLPGSIAAREHSMLQHAASRGHSVLARARTCNLKEAVKLMLFAPLAAALGKRLDQDAEVRVGVLFLHPETAHETESLMGGPPSRLPGKRKRGQTQASRRSQTGRVLTEGIISKAAAASHEDLEEICGYPPALPTQACSMAVRCRRTSCFVAGRYRKLRRDISNSQWMIDGARKGTTSVEEEIANILVPALRADGMKFNSAGREDIDALMLGTGRPFIAEILNARSGMPPLEHFQRLQQQLLEAATGVEVLHLKGASKDICKLLKDGETSKQKSYRVLCELPREVQPTDFEALSSVAELVLAQFTPQRVAHRRALLERERTIHTLAAEGVPDHPRHLLLRLRTQAGTYVKEFCHGDESRTKPSLTSLLSCNLPIKVLELDVTEIHMDFP
ncbi:hypothetical protein WJX84_007512 [Apatococcus fuscideae]|uniref:tRNA pseudouridine(55) synthase n=1 Tax=Apatococcus fuscideae TaxID=2026836 RepID=A0AAW1T2C6_9CHLO